MELMQRMGCKNNDPKEFEEYFGKYLDLINKNKGCCDVVWFATLYGYPKRETHEKYAKQLNYVAERYRKRGIKVSLQLSNTIGHGEYMSARDCSGLVYDGSPVENLVGHDGKVAKYCFCWNGENFRRYILDTISYYCELKPDCVWIDDDLRATNHFPVSFGCFCNDCIGKFNRRFGFGFSREELVAKILYGEPEVREKWIDFIRGGLYDFTYTICSRIHELSPETKIGYQYCANGAYTGYGFEFFFKAMKDATGHDPLSRPGGGAYSDKDGNEFIEKVFFMNWCNSMLPEYVKNKTPEIENLPHVAFQKTSAGTAFETSLYFAYGNTDMSYSDMMYINETEEYYDDLFRTLAANREYWEKLSHINGFSCQAGIRYFMSKNIWRKKLSKGQGFETLSEEKWYSCLAFARDGIPLAFDSDELSVVLLHPDVAVDLTKEEIEYLLSKNVITDGETLEILKGKVDLGIEAEALSPAEVGRRGEEFVSHITLPKELKKWTNSNFTQGKNQAYRLTIDNSSAEILAVYFDTVTGQLYPDETSPYIAEAIVETGKGGKWVIRGDRPWKGVISSLRRDQILNIADYISGNSLPARLNSLIPCVLMPRTDAKGKTVCVSVANVSVGKCKNSSLLIRNPLSENFMFMAMGGVCVKPTYRKEDDGYIVDLPEMDAWTVGTVFCE